MMVWSLLLYLVSVVVPLVITLETLAVVGRRESSASLFCNSSTGRCMVWSLGCSQELLSVVS